MLLPTLDEGLGDLDRRVVFVDNASSDDTVTRIRAAKFDVIALDVNVGYAAAINRGIRQFPDARAILVLNPDVELLPGSVAAMVNVLADRQVGVVAPKMYVPDGQLRLDQPAPRSVAVANLGRRIAGRPDLVPLRHPLRGGR